MHACGTPRMWLGSTSALSVTAALSLGSGAPPWAWRIARTSGCACACGCDAVPRPQWENWEPWSRLERGVRRPARCWCCGGRLSRAVPVAARVLAWRCSCIDRVLGALHHTARTARDTGAGPGVTHLGSGRAPGLPLHASWPGSSLPGMALALALRLGMVSAFTV